MERAKYENTPPKMVHYFKITQQNSVPFNQTRSVVIPEISMKFEAVMLISVIELI
jgi:hypothetical protein